MNENGKPKPGSIGDAWRNVFETNEDTQRKRTDAQLQSTMRQRFLRRTSKEFTIIQHVQFVRSRFNRGLYGPIKKPSRQYDANGNVIYPRGRPSKKRKAK